MRSDQASSFLSRDVANALTRRADDMVVAGDLERASAGYALVARLFPEQRVGENALFASALLDSERLCGHSAEAGLMSYLAFYPCGRFVQEATARLKKLRAVCPQP